ncbi:hypothetical protein PIB30_011341 [Stylosanthes scabra]|uniref:Uncharacterized protein n=1 Tax=Stylosanthes scabra TaxID=79078 RepID=A0ABU6W5Y4_9FABA|nr:hypothetical protein [Stylosanthes scabra]
MSTIVTYLNNLSSKLPSPQELAFFLPGSGHGIMDPNMVAQESSSRQFGKSSTTSFEAASIINPNGTHSPTHPHNHMAHTTSITLPIPVTSSAPTGNLAVRASPCPLSR